MSSQDGVAIKDLGVAVAAFTFQDNTYYQVISCQMPSTEIFSSVCLEAEARDNGNAPNLIVLEVFLH